MGTSFEKLLQRNGTYSLPYLIHLYNDSYDFYFVNNNESITYDENLYTAAAFSYAPNASSLGFDGGGKLEIASRDSLLIDMIESSQSIQLDVIGAINNKGLVQELKTFKHHYGSVSGSRNKMTFTFAKDDRLNMTFPTLIWSNQNNRGNA